MGEQMQFPNKVEDFIEEYSFNDKNEVYTNGSQLIPVFRVEQMIEHYFKNQSQINLCDNCQEFYPQCAGNPEFGDGIGNDNVIKCNQYKPLIG